MKYNFWALLQMWAACLVLNFLLAAAGYPLWCDYLVAVLIGLFWPYKFVTYVKPEPNPGNDQDRYT